MPSSAALAAKTVFVLGAGFTKAFAEEAPLLREDAFEKLRPIFEKSALGFRILEGERDRDPDRKINLENLMTRLASGMPYDWKTGFDSELRPLLSSLKTWLRKQIEDVKVSHNDELRALAKYKPRLRGSGFLVRYADDFVIVRKRKSTA